MQEPKLENKEVKPKEVYLSALETSEAKAAKERRTGCRTGIVVKFDGKGQPVTSGDVVRDVAWKLLKNEAIKCSICGLPSGLKNVILKKSEDGVHYFCAKGCPKIPA